MHFHIALIELTWRSEREREKQTSLNFLQSRFELYREKKKNVCAFWGDALHFPYALRNRKMRNMHLFLSVWKFI